MDIIHDALVELDFPSSMADKIDAYRIILIQIKDLPDVTLSYRDDRLWVWSLLPDFCTSYHHNHTTEVIKLISERFDGVEGDSVILSGTGNGFKIKILINTKELLSGNNLVVILCEFISLLHELTLVIKQEG